MAKGWKAIEDQSIATQEQRERFAQGFKPELRVNAKNSGPFIGRFLEQGEEINNFPVHEYKEPDGRGGWYHKRFTCLSEVNQECPGCKAGMKRKIRGVYNFLQRQRPQLRRDKDNKAIVLNGQYIIDGYQDEVVIANVGGPTAEMLRKSDGNYKGLMSRDFQITYSGDTFQAWTISPVLDSDGSSVPHPMSEQDFALAAQKHNLDEYMKPPSQQEAAQIVARYGANSGAAQAAVPQSAPQPQNPLLAGAQLPPGTNALGMVTNPSGQ